MNTVVEEKKMIPTRVALSKKHAFEHSINRLKGEKSNPNSSRATIRISGQKVIEGFMSFFIDEMKKPEDSRSASFKEVLEQHVLKTQ